MEQTPTETINEIPLSDFIHQQRIQGRSETPEKLHDQVSKVHDKVVHPIHDPHTTPGETDYLSMLYAATLPLKMIQSEPRLTYFPYAEIALLDRYLGDSQAPYSERKQRAAIAIYHLLHDLLSFESLSIVGYQPYQQARMIVETSLERIRKIERPFRSVRNLSDLVGADPASKEIRH